MERLRSYVRWTHHLPVTVCYLLAAVLVAVSAVIRWALDPWLVHYPFMVFFLAVILSALSLNRGTGFFATILSAAVAVLLFVEEKYTFRIAHADDVVGLFTFLLVSFVVTIAGEAMRWLADHLDSEEHQKDALVRQLSHRTRENLQIIGATLAFYSARAPGVESRRFLNAVAERVGAVGRVQQRVFPPGAGEWIGGQEFLDAVCGDILLSVVGRRPVVIAPEAEALTFRRPMASTIGIVLHELVSNALAHAFPNDRSGVISVRLCRRGADGLRLEVADNGVGCGAGIGSGSGTTLVSALAEQMGGKVTWEDAAPGCRVSVTVPRIDR